MNIASKNRLLAVVYLGPVVCGLSGLAMPAGAQNAAAPGVNPRDSIVATAARSAQPLTDEELSKRVQTALHSDPYFYDEHVRVSAKNGVVALRGFVFSDWDLRDALRIAGRAAPQNRVVDDLSIEVGGLR
ncbi:MAG: hypothetical protein JWN43_1778 [Gammaproteobacteria bacterium]|nr:hypothetical protein [Gammaproteobacteria bacterium]